MVLALVAEAASFTCYFGLQRLALRTSAWFAVVTAGLTGNAVSGILALLALPLLALSAVLVGMAVSPGLGHAGLVGIADFVLLAAASAVILKADWPLRGLARACTPCTTTSSLAAVSR